MKTDNYSSMVGAFLLFIALIAISCLDDHIPLEQHYPSSNSNVDFRNDWLRIFGYIDFRHCTAHFDVYVDESGTLVHDAEGTLDYCDGLPGEAALPFGFTAEPWVETGTFRLTSPYFIKDSFLDLWFPGCFPMETYTGIEGVNVFWENGHWVMEVDLEPAYQECLEENENAFYIRFDVEKRNGSPETEPHLVTEEEHRKK